MYSRTACLVDRLRAIPLTAMLLGALCLTVRANETPSSTAKTYDQALNMKSFNEVWETVQNVHWDKSITDERWPALREKYEPRAEQASSQTEMRAVMQEMIGELEQSHFSVIPREGYDAIQGGDAGTADAGLTVRLIDEEAVVTHVADGSSGAKAGIVPGWVLSSIQGKEITGLLAELRNASLGPTRIETLAAVTVQKALTGSEGRSVELTLLNTEGESQQISVELQEQSGKLAQFGNLPPMKVMYESKNLPGGIGYFAFNLFLDPATIMPAFRELVYREESSNGLVIDLRGNIGGLGGMAAGMASVLSDQKTKLGTMRLKQGTMDFAVNESPIPVTCPIAVLIDEVSISSAEIMAGGLKDMGAARVFGSRSAGLALPSNVSKLPNGDGFMFAVANYVSASGKVLERAGVEPDESIVLTKPMLIEESDPVLARAVAWIKMEDKTDDERTPTALEVMMRNVKETGGVEAFKAVKTSRTTANVLIEPQGMKAKMQITTMAPVKFAAEIEMEGLGTNSQVSNGEHCWEESTMSGPRLLSGIEADQLKGQIELERTYNPSKYYKSIENKGIKTVDEKPCYEIALVTLLGEELQLYFSVETGLQLKAVQDLKTAMGPLKVESFFYDYKKFGQLRSPTRVVQKFAGGSKQTISVEKIEYGIKVDEQLFEPSSMVKKLIDRSKAAAAK